MLRFSDYHEAGALLARLLDEYRDRPDVTVLAPRRGAVALAGEVARVLGLPLQVMQSTGEVRDRTVILVDDGFASDGELLSAVAKVRRHRPTRVIAVAPVASRQVWAATLRCVDRCICLATPRPSHNVAFWFANRAAPNRAVPARTPRHARLPDRALLS